LRLTRSPWLDCDGRFTVHVRPRIGSPCESKAPSPAHSRGPIDGSARLAIVLPQAFSEKTEGLSRAIFFLVGRTMVLGELLTGQFEWGPSSRSRGSDMGQLVTDSRFLTASPYSSQVHSTDLEGSSPFFKEKTMDHVRSRPERGSGCPWCSCARLSATSGPILFHLSL
jgi:hypothetical protein